MRSKRPTHSASAPPEPPAACLRAAQALRRGPAAAMACTHKFGAPLYAGVFLNDELLLLGGGGGKKSSGIANRCARAAAAAPAAAGAARQRAT